MLKRKTIILLTTLNTILIVTSAWGLVYQPEEYNDVPDANWSGWPNSNFMAMINDNRHVAPATVIAPNFIITAGHVYCASGVKGDKVRIGTENSYDYVIVDHRSKGGGQVGGTSSSRPVANVVAEDGSAVSPTGRTRACSR